MITCKPRFSVQLFLFGFLFVLYGFCFMMIGNILNGAESIWLLVGAILTLIIAILFTIKTLIGYKTLSIDKTKIAIKYPFRTFLFEIKDCSSWEEIEIKTFNNQVFKQVNLEIKHHKISFSQQEHTDYDKLVQFLKKNVKKKAQ
ncbi:MAG: hypothetical protein MUE81_21050 [Thermoflexibacter sp.]|nr:hypothetical protein [Thermoflexibacter sp.]